MQFSFFLLSGYVGVSLLSPVMHNLWIWRVWSLCSPKISNRLFCCYLQFLISVIKWAGYWECKLLLCDCNYLCVLSGVLSLLIVILASSHLMLIIVAVSLFFTSLYTNGGLCQFTSTTHFIMIIIAFDIFIFFFR